MSAYTNAATICTPEQLAQAGASGFRCLSRSESLGLLVVGAAGLVSLVAVLGLFLAIARNAVRRRRQWRQAHPLQQPLELIKQPIEIFILSLLFADLLQGLGASLEIRFISSGIVKTGSLCTAQGALQNLGQAAIAMTTLVITLYTFISLWWPKAPMGSLKAAGSVVGLIWSYLVLAIVVSVSVHKDPSYYAPTPYWCWISSNYSRYRVAFENFWLWLAFACSILYLPLILMIQGYIRPSTDTWWKFSVESRDERILPVSLYIAISALAYCVPVLPTSMSRWFSSILGDDKPFATVAGQFTINAIFSMSGILDVVVFLLTRRGLFGFDSPTPTLDSRASKPGSILADAHGPPALPGIDPDNDIQMAPVRQADIGAANQHDHNGAANQHDHNGAANQHDHNGAANQHDHNGAANQHDHNGAANQHDHNINGAANQHDGRIFPQLRWRIILFIGLWLGVNAADGAWIYYFVQSATDPNPHSAANRSNTGWIVYYTMMWIWGFFWGAFNIVICGAIFVSSYRWFKDIRAREGNGQSKARRIMSSTSFAVLWWTVHVLILFPAAIILSLGPFFSQSAVLKPIQQYVWNTRCNRYTAEAILYGRPYNAPPGAVAHASFYFWQNGVRTALYDYNITTSETDANLRYLQFAGAEPGVTIPANLYPTVQNVSLELSSGTFTAYCTTGVGVPVNATSPCIFGTFDTTSYLTITTNDTRTDTGATELRAIDPIWKYADSDDAPNYILKDVVGNTPGTDAIRTAVTEPGVCLALKTCLARAPGGDLLVAIGLTLIQQDYYAHYCTTPNTY